MNDTGPLPRPGATHGQRPERNVPQAPGQLDATLGRWLQRLHRKRPTPRRFASMLSKLRAEEQQLRQRSSEERDAQIRKLRTLVRHGLEDHVVCALFAQLCVRVEETYGFTLHEAQLYAAWCMMHGSMVEMATGEGKTITAALTATAVALGGVPVHVVTANDYLVERDAKHLHKLYRQFGLRVDFVTAEMDEDARRNGYAADIVYCSNKQLIFDYLRDGQQCGNVRKGLPAELASLFSARPAEPMLRGLCFAIIDEADNALIDDARTPMIISRNVPASRSDITEATVALGIARSLDTQHYDVDRQHRSVGLTERGKAKVRKLTERLKGKWRQTRYAEERVRQALTVQHIFRLDQDYLIEDDRVLLVDESTGRVLRDRKLQHGMHRLLEVHVGCPPSDDTQPLAALSFQGFFPRFLQLCGMSGTLWEARRELYTVYQRDVVRIPQHRPSQRRHLPMTICATAEAQLEVALSELCARRDAGQPILIGTRTVACSERISQALTARNIDHQVLNARHDAAEAAVIAAAGTSAMVTVATNMAGRGTDIPLHGDAAANGGLHVLSLEVNDSARVDRQLFGRAARQGDPGSVHCVVTLEDELVVNFLHPTLLNWVKRLVSNKTPGSQVTARWIVRLAQRRCERQHASLRAAASQAAGQMDRHLAFTGESE